MRYEKITDHEDWKDGHDSFRSWAVSKIESIEYIHNNSNNTYIFDGNVSSGLTNEGIVDIKNRQIKLDMVSRTGAVLDITSIEDILLVDTSYEFGFDGIIKIVLSSAATISSIQLPTNGTINSVSIDAGETWMSNWDNFVTTSVSEILISIFKLVNLNLPVTCLEILEAEN